MKLQTLVVGFDGSADAHEALDTAVQLAQEDSTVHVVTAYSYPSDREMADLIATLPDEYAADFDRIAAPRRQLQIAERILEAAGIDHKGHLVEGDPAGAILDAAEASSADLVVVGSRGVGRVARFLRGSVSSRVASHTPANLLIVHADKPEG